MTIDSYNLRGKNILITGSSRGIGAATARLAKKYGANVILHGKTDSDNLRKIADELQSPYMFCDVAKDDEVRSAVGGLERVDVLVNNAAIQISKPFTDFTQEDWARIMAVNVGGVANVSNAVIPKMQEQGHGKIINISSAKGYLATSGRCAYSASKAALINLTATMARELSPTILVNGIAPGFTNTEMTDGTMSPRVKKHIDGSLLKRMAKPEEIAEPILFLASDKSSFIVGQTILVDGGFYLSI